MKTTFELQTKIGLVTFEVIGPNYIYLQTPGHGKHDRGHVIIRGKQESGNCRFVLEDVWRGLTWKDNNTQVGMTDNPRIWDIKRAVNLDDHWDGRKFKEPSDAAHQTFYNEVSVALNQFYIEHRQEVDGQRYARNLELCEARSAAVRQKVTELQKELQAAEVAVKETDALLNKALFFK